MSSKSIQKYFASISLANIEAYMKQAGWSSVQRGERLDFQRTDPASHETQTLYVTARADHPKFRRLVPNLVFSLSVIEAREAIDVAESIFQAEANHSQEASPNAETRSSSIDTRQSACSEYQSTRWLRLNNSSSAPIYIRALEGDSPIRIPAGEAVLFRSADPLVHIDLQCDIAIKNARCEEHELYCDLPGRNASDINLLIDNATAVFSAKEIEPSQIANIKKHCERFYFANGFTGQIRQKVEENRLSLPNVLRTLAMLLSDVHKDLQMRVDFGSVFFELSRWLLSAWDITLCASPQAPQQLSTALISDFGGSPMQTHNWLQSNCILLEEHA